MSDGKENYGVKPFVFRGEFYYFFYPALAFGSGFSFEENWEGGASKDILDSLSMEERGRLEHEFVLGWNCYQKINELFYSRKGESVRKDVAFRLYMSRADLLAVVAL